MAKETKNKKKINNVMKYSGMAMELFAIIMISVFLGRFLDDYFGLEKPYIMLSLIVILFGGYMYRMYLDLTKNQN